MGYKNLSEACCLFKGLKTAATDDLKIDAANLAILKFGINTIAETPSLVNLAALYLESKITHEISSGITKLVAETDLDVYPNDCPVLLERSGIINSKLPANPLFLETSSVGWYWVKSSLYLIGANYPDGVRVASVNPDWSGKEITGHTGEYQDYFIKESLDDWTIKAVRFLLIYSLLLEAEGTPCLIKKHKDGFIRVTIDNKKFSSAEKFTGEINFTVKGHLRYQPHGPGRILRKWIWINEHVSRRWIEP